MRTLVFKAIIHIATKLRNGSISSNSSSSSMRHAVSPPTFERSTSLDNLKAEVVELVRWFYKCITKHCMQLCVRVFVHTFRVGTTVKNNQWRAGEKKKKKKKWGTGMDDSCIASSTAK